MNRPPSTPRAPANLPRRYAHPVPTADLERPNVASTHCRRTDEWAPPTPYPSGPDRIANEGGGLR
jgi:hypothetical protein